MQHIQHRPYFIFKTRSQELEMEYRATSTSFFTFVFHFGTRSSVFIFYYTIGVSYIPNETHKSQFKNVTQILIHKHIQSGPCGLLWNILLMHCALCTDVIFCFRPFFCSHFSFLSGTFFLSNALCWLICQWNQQTFTAKWIYIRIMEWKKNGIHASTNYTMHKILQLIDSSYAIQIIIGLRILLWSFIEEEKKLFRNVSVNKMKRLVRSRPLCTLCTYTHTHTESHRKNKINLRSFLQHTMQQSFNAVVAEQSHIHIHIHIHNPHQLIVNYNYILQFITM